jgi:HEAT repeat protein
MPQGGRRALKRRVFELLKWSDFDLAIEQLHKFPAHKVVNPLFSFLHNTDQKVKWAAVTAMGAIVARLAEENIEAARVIIRRLMWNLNDESGGIGWGSPEAMGEILACHEGLAREYTHVLISYTREDGNYLEHEILQRGLLWGIGRLAQVRPQLVQDSTQYLMPYLKSRDATVRGLAAWIMGSLGVEEVRPMLEKLAEDHGELQIYVDCRLIERQVRDLAEEALGRSI